MPEGGPDLLFLCLASRKNVTAMKTLFLFPAMLLLAAACNPETFSLNPTVCRNDVMGGSSGHSQGGDSAKVISPSVRDTAVLVSGVEYPEDYDWQRDTAFGQVSGKVVLFRNGERILEIPTGAEGKASLDPDMHHLVEGHLYAEYTDASHTYISRDGKSLYTFEGREYLRGILTLDGKLYTLSQRRDGNGFVLRCDGKVLMDKDSGLILKSFGDYPDRQSGALYENEGKVCFHYSKGSGDARVWYSVQDLTESQIYLDDGELLDARFFGDDLCVVSILNGRGVQMTIGKRQNVAQKAANPKMSGVSLLKNGQEVLAMGKIKYIMMNLRPSQACIWSFSGVRTSMDWEYNFVVDADKNIYMYGSTDGKGTYVVNSSGKRMASISGLVPYSRRIAAMCGERMYLALAPADGGGKAVIWSGGKTSELTLNGFLTGMDVRSK